MAVNNLKAFDQLRETTAGSLSQKEKADLNAINQNDIREAKSKIENKTFVVDGRTMTLKYIVENLKMNKSGDRATLFGKEIARGSELGAAIQVYALAHNKTIGPAVIDGKVGRGTVRGLELTQTDMKAEGKAKEVASQGEKIGVRDLPTHVFTGEFNRLNSTKKFKSMGLLNSNGYLNFASKYSPIDKKGNCVIKYISQQDGKEKTLSVKIKKDVNDKIDCFAMAKDIKTAVESAESKIYKNNKESRILSGIDDYDIAKSRLSKKAMAYLRENGVVKYGALNASKSYFVKNKLKFRTDGGLDFGNLFHIPKVEVDKFYTGGKFNATNFGAYISRNDFVSFMNGMADKYYANSVRTRVNSLKSTKITTGSVVSFNSKVSQAEYEINRLTSLGVTIPVDVRRDLDKCKESGKDVSNYKKISELLDKEFSEYEKKVTQKIGDMSLEEVKSFRVKMTKLVTSLENKTLTRDYKYVYNVYLKMNNGEKLYQSLVNRAKKIRDRIV